MIPGADSITSASMRCCGKASLLRLTLTFKFHLQLFAPFDVNDDRHGRVLALSFKSATN